MEDLQGKIIVYDVESQNYNILAEKVDDKRIREIDKKNVDELKKALNTVYAITYEYYANKNYIISGTENGIMIWDFDLKECC